MKWFKDMKMPVKIVFFVCITLIFIAIIWTGQLNVLFDFVLKLFGRGV